MSEGQQKKVWYLMYQLEKYDPAPEGVQLRDRLCGLISRQFGVTAFPTQPFRFLTFSQGNALIEGLKKLTERKELEYLHSDRYRRDAEVVQHECELLELLELDDLQGEAREAGGVHWNGSFPAAAGTLWRYRKNVYPTAG